MGRAERRDARGRSFREPGADSSDDEDGPPERPAYRDPELRVSGSASLPVTVVSGRRR